VRRIIIKTGNLGRPAIEEPPHDETSAAYDANARADASSTSMTIVFEAVVERIEKSAGVDEIEEIRRRRRDHSHVPRSIVQPCKQGALLGETKLIDVLKNDRAAIEPRQVCKPFLISTPRAARTNPRSARTTVAVVADFSPRTSRLQPALTSCRIAPVRTGETVPPPSFTGREC